MREPSDHIRTLQRRLDFLKAKDHKNSYTAAEIGSLEWALLNLTPTEKRQWVDLRDTDVARLICLAGISPDWVEYKLADPIVENVINLFKERNS